MSMLSLTPAAMTFGWFASIAIAGSFCLFCENGVSGLPTVTSVSPLAAAANETMPSATAVASAKSAIFLISPPRLLLG